MSDKGSTDSTAGSTLFGDGGGRSKVPEKLPEYLELHEETVDRREEYWSAQAERIRWHRPFVEVVEEDLSEARISWFSGGKLNLCENVLDAHIGKDEEERKAFVFLPRDGKAQSWTHLELLSAVKKMAGYLKNNGVGKGDRVALWTNGRPEAVISMLACARIGAVYVPLSRRLPVPPAADRVLDCEAKVVLVEVVEGGEAGAGELEKLSELVGDTVMVAAGDGRIPDGVEPFSRILGGEEDEVEPEPMEAEAVLFLQYARASAGMPRAGMFAVGGYGVQAAAVYDQIFGSFSEEPAEWGVLSTLELSSSVAQSCGFWGPLLNGHCVVFMEDGRNADARRVLSSLESWWPLVLLTTPLQLARWRNDLGDLDVGHKLRFSMVASSGDMLTPRLATFGGSSLVASEERLINLWSQSETGVPLIATYPHEGLNRKGALGLMTLGVDGQVLSDLGEPCRTNESGQLVFCRSWPAMIRGIWNQQDRFQEIYFQRVEGCYSTNDGMRQDREGFYWFMRRLDDVVKVRGSSVATSEVECAMLTHPDVKEAAVLGLAGEGGDELVAFVSAEEERVSTGPDRERLEQEIHEYLRERVGEFFVPTRMYVSSQLPRTRSGKIVRRLLRRIATGDVAAGEDLSHVANPRTVESLMENTSPKKE